MIQHFYTAPMPVSIVPEHHPRASFQSIVPEHRPAASSRGIVPEVVPEHRSRASIQSIIPENHPTFSVHSTRKAIDASKIPNTAIYIRSPYTLCHHGVLVDLLIHLAERK